MALSARQQEIKDEFVRVRGTWGDSWAAILELDPEFLLAYLNFSAVPWRKNQLDSKTREFIYIVVDAAATHMFGPGVRQHVKAALAAGATPAEIMEVLECVATLSIQTMTVGVPILAEVLAERGIRGGPVELTDHQRRLKAGFAETWGGWNPLWDELLELDPEIFDAYSEFSSHPWKHGTLSPKVREFVYLALDASATHLYRPGIKLHIQTALDHGATSGELLEVLEVASVIGIHSVALSAPIVIEEAGAAGIP